MGSSLSPACPDLATLEQLYEAYHRQALGLAYRMLEDRAEAEEVVQDVFLASWRAARGYDATRGSTRTWLLAMVRNRSIDLLRIRQRRPTRALDERMVIRDERDFGDEAARRVDAESARRALEALPAEQRQVVELAYFGGLSHTEIAAQMCTPVGTVKGRLRLALERLRLALNAPPEVTQPADGQAETDLVPLPASLQASVPAQPAL